MINAKGADGPTEAVGARTRKTNWPIVSRVLDRRTSGWRGCVTWGIFREGHAELQFCWHEGSAEDNNGLLWRSGRYADRMTSGTRGTTGPSPRRSVYNGIV